MKTLGKRVIADVICSWKMPSYNMYMSLDDVTSFLRLKDVINTCKRMRRSLSNGGKLGNAEDFKCVFVVNCALESK